MVRRALIAALILVVALAPARAQSAGAADSLLAAADAAWDAGRADEARAAYAAVVGRDSAASPRAVFRLATLLARHGELPSAIDVFRLYRRLEPSDQEGSVGLARTLAWAGRYRESVATYDSVLARDAAYRDAALGRAQTLAWAGRYGEAVDAYEQWTRGHPDDRSGEAAKGLARVAGWRGELAQSELLWRSLTARYPDDPEAWTGLAQVLRWSGRAGEAEAALQHALGAQPGYGDALAQMQWVRAELAPSAEPIVAYSNDSDENRSTYVGLTLGLRPSWNGRLLAAAGWREAHFLALHGTSVGARLTSVWMSPWRVMVRTTAGVAQTRSNELRISFPADAPETTEVSGPTHALPILGLRVSKQLSPRIQAGIGYSYEPFDETAPMIRQSLAVSSSDADVAIAFPRALTLSATGSSATVSRGSVNNDRAAFSGTLRWALRRAVSFGVSARTFGYETQPGDGYFAPRHYTLAEGNARYDHGGEVGWIAFAEGGLGTQWIVLAKGDPAASRAAQRAQAGVAYRPSPGSELGVSGGFANVASPGTQTAAEYRAFSVTVRGRMRW